MGEIFVLSSWRIKMYSNVLALFVVAGAVAIADADPECCILPDCTDYRGTKADTASGKPCINWDLYFNTPFDQREKDAKDANDTKLLYDYARDDVVNNYCRNPDWDKSGAWCYVSPGGKWETCGILRCYVLTRSEFKALRKAFNKRLPGPPWPKGDKGDTDTLITWRADHRCGSKFFLNGKPAECNPDGVNPCCSKHGWCG